MNAKQRRVEIKHRKNRARLRAKRKEQAAQTATPAAARTAARRTTA